MQKTDKPYIIVIGSSAGGLPALMELVAGLPASFPAAILLVQHIPPYSDSNLHHILNRMGPLPAVAAKDGDKVLPGHIYVATADHHLLVEKDKLIVRKGPRKLQSCFIRKRKS